MIEVLDPVFFFLVAFALWGSMALRYPAPVAFLVVFLGAWLFFFPVFGFSPAILWQAPTTPLWTLDTISMAALLARLLVPRLNSLRDTAPALAAYAPALTGAAAAFAFDEESGSGQPASLAGSMSNTLAGLSPLGLPLIAAALLMEESVGRIMVAAILPALALTVVGAFLAGQPEGSASGLRLSDLGAELLAPAVAVIVLILILSGVATPAEAFAVSTLLLLAILLRLGGLRETAALLNEALPDVARVVVLILAAAPIYSLFYYVVRPETLLWLDFPVVFFGLSLLAAAAFGIVGGSLAAIVAMVLLFGAPASANAYVQPAQVLIAWVLAAEAGRFVTARWQGGLEGAGAVWVFVLLGV